MNTPVVPPRRSAPGALASEDSLEAFRKYQRTGDRNLRDELVMRHLGLAVAMAGRYRGRGEDPDDLRQVAIVGLVKAVDRFDPDRGTAFSTFAVPTILGELKRHFRDSGWTIRVPRRLQELRRQAEAARRRLEQEQAHAPTVEQIADVLHESCDDVREALELGSCYQPASLEGHAHRRELADGKSPSATTACRRAEADRLLKVLDKRRRQIFVLRYYRGLTQQEIADRVGISQMHVSRLLRAGLEDMRQAAAA